MLPTSFYQRTDVLEIARDLLGCVLVTTFEGESTSGIITETEAYAGTTDRASHAYGGRRTRRTEVMYMGGGVAYVYLCYGIHHLFNLVTNVADNPHAVLVRSIEPLEGITTMLERRGKTTVGPTLTSGPGALSQALGISTLHTGISLSGPHIYILQRESVIKPENIVASPRIGVAYAGPDASLPYRYNLATSCYVSKGKQVYKTTG